MKRLLLTALLAATPLLGLAQVNFNFSIGDPGYYGRIVIDNGQQPNVLNDTPVIAYQNVSGVYAAPIYLRVSRYCSQDWQECCQKYSACFVPVYFVDDVWYQESYIPWYRNRYPYDVPKYQNRYPYDVPKYQNRYPYNVPKYAPAPRGGNTWHGIPQGDNTFHGIPQERYQRNSNEVEIQRDERR